MACLGALPGLGKQLLSDGDVRVFTLYNCKEVDTYPCDTVNNANGDWLELGVILTQGYDADEVPVQPGNFVQPGDVVVQLRDDPASRRIKNNTVIWSTGTRDHHG